MHVGQRISRNKLKEGDLLFFHTNRSGVSHVGIYIGNNNFIHAANRRCGVITTSIDDPYFSQRYRGARRLKNNLDKVK